MPEGKGYQDKSKAFAAGTATGAAISKTHSVMKDRAKARSRKNASIKKGVKVSQSVRELNKSAVIQEHFENKDKPRKSRTSLPANRAKSQTQMRREVTEAKPKKPFPGKRGPKVGVLKRMIKSMKGLGKFSNIAVPKALLKRKRGDSVREKNKS